MRLLLYIGGSILVGCGRYKIVLPHPLNLENTYRSTDRVVIPPGRLPGPSLPIAYLHSASLNCTICDVIRRNTCSLCFHPRLTRI
jgi:hypothetical protein